MKYYTVYENMEKRVEKTFIAILYYVQQYISNISFVNSRKPTV